MTSWCRRTVMAETLYQRVGGDQWFFELVARFYHGVAGDPRLRPLYPEDLNAARAHLAGFLIQYWGGPSTYSEARGHPRLRMRHSPFVIRQAQRDAWLSHMTTAVRSGGLSEADTAAMLSYFDNAASMLINAPG
jgi:hemoglobin